jgi:hypothetical protein
MIPRRSDLPQRQPPRDGATAAGATGSGVRPAGIEIYADYPILDLLLKQ